MKRNRNRVTRLVLLCVTPLACAAAIDAQEIDRLFVGDPRIDGTHIAGFQVTWSVTPHTNEGVPLATNRVEERVEIIDQPPSELLRFTQVWYDSLGAELFTTVRVADRRTLAFHAFHSGGAPGVFGHLDFDSTHVSGVYIGAPEGPTQHFSLLLENEVFAGFAGLLFSALPLEVGFGASFSAFSWGGTTNPSEIIQSYAVVDREEIAVPGSPSIEAYRIATRRGGGSELSYWVTREPPYFLRAESTSTGGGRTVYEIESWSPSPW